MNTLFCVIVFAAHLFVLLVNFEHTFSNTTEPEARVTFVVTFVSLVFFVLFMSNVFGVK